MSDTQAERRPSFGVIRVQPRAVRATVDYSEQKNVDKFWENARRAAQIEREQRNAAGHDAN